MKPLITREVVGVRLSSRVTAQLTSAVDSVGAYVDGRDQVVIDNKNGAEIAFDDNSANGLLHPR